ncbi:chromodomain-helicase-DNA-binding protein 1-like isoform X2 [Artemia franciscana]|uniref:chromodomain-helicase-DNA-binding protein 1-like isoform X2 n=1 Tax=Artemia franciscana TaxID=6661 RepID=UPI0032DB2E30
MKTIFHIILLQSVLKLVRPFPLAHMRLEYQSSLKPELLRKRSVSSSSEVSITSANAEEEDKSQILAELPPTELLERNSELSIASTNREEESKSVESFDGHSELSITKTEDNNTSNMASNRCMSKVPIPNTNTEEKDQPRIFTELPPVELIDRKTDLSITSKNGEEETKSHESIGKNSKQSITKTNTEDKSNLVSSRSSSKVLVTNKNTEGKDKLHTYTEEPILESLEKSTELSVTSANREEESESLESLSRNTELFIPKANTQQKAKSTFASNRASEVSVAITHTEEKDKPHIIAYVTSSESFETYSEASIINTKEDSESPDRNPEIFATDPNGEREDASNSEHDVTFNPINGNSKVYMLNTNNEEKEESEIKGCRPKRTPEHAHHWRKKGYEKKKKLDPFEENYRYLC